jgi:hypothetical protein
MASVTDSPPAIRQHATGSEPWPARTVRPAQRTCECSRLAREEWRGVQLRVDERKRAHQRRRVRGQPQRSRRADARADDDERPRVQVARQHERRSVRREQRRRHGAASEAAGLAVAWGGGHQL